MKLKTFVLGAALLLLITSISNGSVMFAHSSSILNGNTLYVGGSGPGNYTKIQDAIDNASDGDTVYVYNGIYTESNILVDKTLNLVGESKEGVIVDTSPASLCSFKFMQVSNTNISSFTMKNGLLGIWIEYSNTDVEHIDITNCIVHDIRYCGIMVIGNQGYMRNSVIKNCEVYNTMYGIELGGFFDSTISECNLHDNDCGIHLIGNVYNNYIYHNNFVNNAEHAKAQETPGECQIWDNDYPSGGNYWDDYTGVDYYRGPNQDIPGSDAIGDTSYILDGDEEDRYPLMPPMPNLPPYVPSNPNPTEGETHVSVDADLSWTGGDPDGDPVTYDVYFGTMSPPPQVAENQTDTLYDPPGDMEYGTMYYWRIISWDTHGESNASYEWHFTTVQAEPDLDCEGSLSWTDVEPGATVEGSFTVENIGDSTSKLDWMIESSYPEWGTWIFDPDSGEDLTPEDGPQTVQVEVVAPDEEETEFEGEIKVVNTDDPSDYCTIPVYLKTPVSQNEVNSQLLQFIQRFIERFPLLERMFELHPHFNRI